MSAQSNLFSAVSVVLFVWGTSDVVWSGENPRSNAEIMVELSREAAEEFCADLKIPDTSSVAVTFENGEVERFFNRPLLETFRRHFVSLYARIGSSNIDIAVAVPEITVSYGAAFSDGFFSSRKSQRVIDVSLRLSATRNSDGKILSAETKRRSFSDTVYVHEISDLQESSKHIAAAPMPDRSALERFIGPLIIAGAAGIAVYLFFTIRS